MNRKLLLITLKNKIAKLRTAWFEDDWFCRRVLEETVEKIQDEIYLLEQLESEGIR